MGKLASALAGLLVAMAATTHGAEQGANEYQVKAAYLYNFVRFVEWPPDSLTPDEPFVITVLGVDPFGSVLDDTLRGKHVEGHEVVVRRAARVEDVGRSQLLFISRSEHDRLPAILKGVGTRPILTVGDMKGFAARGGIVGFRLEEDRVRLDVSLSAAERSKLKVKSDLLRVAKIVEAGGGGS